MKKNIQTTLTLLFLLPLGLQAQSVAIDFSQYQGSQITNSDFEDWSGTEFDNVPVGWHSFESVELGTPSWLYSSAQSKEHTSCFDKGLHEGTLGEFCLKLVPRNVLNLALANGTITTGRMHAGSTTPENTNNHAQMDLSVTETSNGTPYYALLTEKPNYIAVWLKFISNDSDNPFATISAIITDGTYYQDPEKENTTYANVYAKAKNAEIASNGGKWQRIVVPFTIQDNSITPKGILVTISTNAKPGKGNENDVLYVDDLELIYTQSVTIPAYGYFPFTNIAQKNHSVVMPEGLTGYTLGLTADGNPIVTKTYKAGDVIPYETSLLLEGKAGNYEFKTTLYEKGESPVLNDDGKLVDGAELNNAVDGYKYFRIISNSEHNPGFVHATDGSKIKPGEALLRIKENLAADSYDHVLVTPTTAGDIDDNGNVDATDVKALVNRLLGNQQGMTKFLIPDADVNGDESTNVADVTELVNILINE